MKTKSTLQDVADLLQDLETQMKSKVFVCFNYPKIVSLNKINKTAFDRARAVVGELAEKYGKRDETGALMVNMETSMLMFEDEEKKLQYQSEWKIAMSEPCELLY